MKNLQKMVFIFDFDGTIADTHSYIVDISNRLCSEFNYNPIDPDELNKLKNMTTQEVIQHLKVPVMKIPAILAKAKKEFHKDVKLLAPIRGIIESLHHINDTGRQIGILSSNTLENITQFLNNHKINIFGFIHTTSKVWSKNTCLKKLIKEYDFDPANILYIGDEVRDIVAAQRLGVKVIAVTWGYNSKKILKKHKPDYLINSPHELIEISKQL